MNVIKLLFRLYIHGSIHVGLSVLALVLMTNHMFNINFSAAMAIFAFCGTMFSYNFMKYESFYRLKRPRTKMVKAIVVISLLALTASGIAFLKLESRTQVTAVALLAFTALYAVPFFPNQKNLRNLSGIKIYLVAFCWAGVTIVLPLQEAHVALSTDVFLKFGQRFLLVIILILIFEIIDLAEDDPHLRTIPQVIGIEKTKWLNLFFLMLFYFLEFFKSVVDVKQLVINVVLVTVTALFTFYANPERPKTYTLFWVESIPIAWLGMVVLAGYL